MTVTQTLRAIDKGETLPIYAFIGTDATRRNMLVERLKQHLLPPGADTLDFLAMDKPDAARMIQCGMVPPMLAEKRLLIVQDFQPLLTTRTADLQGECAAVLDFLQNMPDSVCLVFCAAALEAASGAGDTARGKLLNFLKNAPGFVELDAPDADASRSFAKEQLASCGKSFGSGAWECLSERLGADSSRLETELERLIALTGERKTVTVRDVETYVTATAEYNVFRLLDALLEGNMLHAQNIVQSALRTDAPHHLIYLIDSRLRSLTLIRRAMEKNENLAEVAAALSIKPGALRFLQKTAKLLTSDQFEQRHNACVNALWEMQSGKAPPLTRFNALLLELAVPSQSR